MQSKRTIAALGAGILVLLWANGLTAGQGRYQPIQMGEKAEEILEVVDDMDLLFEKRGLVFRDEEATALLEEICTATLKDQPAQPHMDFQFRIIREPLPNAFAMPNGSIYFTTGMLGALEDEAQVATICAHEANHVLGHHTILSMRSQRRKKVGAMIGSLGLGWATAGVGGYGGYLLQQVTGLGLEILYVASVLGYSRDLEEEADRRATAMVVAAGYDPTATPEVFEILGQDYEGLRTETKTFWLDHPKLQDRIAYMEEILEAEYPDASEREDWKRGRERYLSKMEAVAQHNVQLLIKSGLARTAVAMGEKLVSDYGESPENLVLFGEAWSNLGGQTILPAETELTKRAKKERRRDRYKKTRQERWRQTLSTEDGRSRWEINRDNAEAAYRAALALEPTYAPAHRALGYLYEKDEKFAEAIPEFEAYLAAEPKARDRFVIQRHLEELRERGAQSNAPTDEAEGGEGS